MSLEIISKIESTLEGDSISEVIKKINNAGYKNVYYLEEFSSYGFVRITDEYIEGTPSLFDLVISESSICLAVYGDLNDLDKAKSVIESVFMEIGIRLFFFEEGEE